MSTHSIHGHLLEVTVVSGHKLKDTEWISRQDPYVYLEYGPNQVRTRTCPDGGKNPTFQEKFKFTLIEGLRELSITVWNSNTFSADDHIGSGKVQLHRALSTGFDDSCWPLLTKTGRNAGEIKLIMHYKDANIASKPYAPSAPSYVPPSSSSVPSYSAHAPPSNSLVPPYYAPPPAPASSYPPPHSAPPYSTPPASLNSHAYPPTSSPYPSYPFDFLSSSTYPPTPTTYPPSPYPPPTSVYPPSPFTPPSSTNPPGSYSGVLYQPTPY